MLFYHPEIFVQVHWQNPLYFGAGVDGARPPTPTTASPPFLRKKKGEKEGGKEKEERGGRMSLSLSHWPSPPLGVSTLVTCMQDIKKDRDKDVVELFIHVTSMTYKDSHS